MEATNPILYFRQLNEIEHPLSEDIKRLSDYVILTQTLITRSREAADSSEHSEII